MSDTRHYRPNVGIMIVNGARQILVGEPYHYPGEWMMPQGGIDTGESPRLAMERELREETGLSLDDLNVLREHPDWIHYLFPKPQYKDDIFYHGQKQKWFLLEYNGLLPDPADQAVVEFSRFDWVSADWLISRTPEFRLATYQRVMQAFTPFMPG